MKEHPLLFNKGERCNLGKFQHTTHCAKATLANWGVKAYITNLSALTLGMKGGMDRRAPPTDAAPPGPLPEIEGKATLKQHQFVGFAESTKNQLDKAAWVFGDLEAQFKQTLICEVIKPTQNYHSRPQWAYQSA